MNRRATSMFSAGTTQATLAGPNVEHEPGRAPEGEACWQTSPHWVGASRAWMQLEMVDLARDAQSSCRPRGPNAPLTAALGGCMSAGPGLIPGRIGGGIMIVKKLRHVGLALMLLTPLLLGAVPAGASGNVEAAAPRNILGNWTTSVPVFS